MAWFMELSNPEFLNAPGSIAKYKAGLPPFVYVAGVITVPTLIVVFAGEPEELE